MSKSISIVINLDTRSGWLEEQTEDRSGQLPGAQGSRSLDFILDGVENKRQFFQGFAIEMVLYLDVHEPLPPQVYETLHQWQHDKRIDTMVFARHNETWKDNYFPMWNDISYLHALTLARGSYVCHFDSDVAAFRRDDALIRQWLEKLDKREWSFISLPSNHSPAPVGDTAFDYWWASTRFFLTLRENVEDHTEMRKCITPGDYIWKQYGDRQRKCPWMEHVLGLMADKNYGRNKTVYYPPMDYSRMLIFSWHKYRRGLYRELMSKSFDEVTDLVQRWGGIQYPCDVVPQ